MNAKIFAVLETRGRDFLRRQFVTIAEAERMKRRGECSRWRAPSQSMRVYREILPAEPSDSQPTPSPITFGNMLANVGLADTEEVKAVRAKIRNYRRVRQHDPEFRIVEARG